MLFNWRKLVLLILTLWLISAISGYAENSNETSKTDHPVELDPVVVTATRTPHRLKDTPVITDLITRAEIEATGAENIGEVLEHKAGIIIHRDGHGDGVQLQGLDSEYILILVDGEPQVGRIAGKLDMARMAVENAFGRLKGRWRCLLKRMDIAIANVPNVVATCVVLHNYCEMHGDECQPAWIYRDSEISLIQHQHQNTSTSACRDTALIIRNALKSYLYN